MHILRHVVTIARFSLSLSEALMKCLPVFVIQLLAIYPLIAVGQGQEAMRALLDPALANISWFLFPICLAYSCILTAFFLFFLLDRWNYCATDSARAFCRIWVPSMLTLFVGLLWPVAVETSSRQSTLWDASLGFLIVVVIMIMVGCAWKLTKPVPSRKVMGFIAAAIAILVGLWILGPILAFYGASILAITGFCALISRDFRDDNPGFRPWEYAHRVGIAFAVISAASVFLLSRTSVTLRMFLGAPTIIVCGFAFIVALAFIVTALLSRVSSVLVQLAWMLMIGVVFLSPLNHEPIRTIQASPKLPHRRPPSQHFIEWLRNRPQIRDSAAPYPVFFVAAQGGGVRAAYWTSTLLAGLEERYPGFSDHIYAISGVSGGSVGGALFTSLYRDKLINGDTKCAPLEAGGKQGLRPCASYIFRWDFLGPPLSGFLLNDIPFGWYGVRRASYLEQGLESAWFGSTNTRLFEMPFQAMWLQRPYQVPSLILNTTSADDGRRIVVSNLQAKGELTDEPDVEELLRKPLRLSTATFLSARFPIISPVAVGNSPEHGAIRLVDGGYMNYPPLNCAADGTASL